MVYNWKSEIDCGPHPDCKSHFFEITCYLLIINYKSFNCLYRIFSKGPLNTHFTRIHIQCLHFSKIFVGQILFSRLIEMHCTNSSTTFLYATTLWLSRCAFFMGMYTKYTYNPDNNHYEKLLINFPLNI